MSREMDDQVLGTLVNAAQERSACPASELLARAAAGEADAALRRRIADHLAGCSSCREEYRVAVALGPWARETSSDAALGDSHVGAASPWHVPTLAYAAAALLAVGVTVALALWTWSLRNENARLTTALQQRRDDSAARLAARDETQRNAIAELERRLADASAPALNVPIVDLLPRDLVRGAAVATSARVPANARYITFVITPVSDPAAVEHALEIVDAQGAVRWRGSGLRPSAERTFTLTVPGALVPAGPGHVRLYEQRASGSRLIADYSIVVQ